MSESVHAGDEEAFSADLRASARQAAFAMFFFTAAMLVLAMPLIRIVQPGASYEVLATVAPVLVANLVALAPFSLLFVLNRGFFAHSDTRTPFFIALGQSALTLGVAWYCSTLPSADIAVVLTLAVSVLILLQAITTFLLLRGRIGPAVGRGVGTALLQFLVAGAAAGAAGYGVLLLLGGTGEGAFAVRGFFGAVLASAAVTAAMTVVYGLGLVALRNREALALIRRLRGRGSAPEDPARPEEEARP